MLSSLRARLLLWYTAILALVIMTFAGSVCYLFWRSLLVDIDRDLRASAASLVSAIQPAPFGGFDLDRPLEFRETDDGREQASIYYGVWSANGDPVDRFPVDADLAAPPGSGFTTRVGRREFATAGPDGARVMVARDLTDARGQVLAFAGVAALAGAVALAVSLVGGWFLVGRALAPVARISRTAAAMSAGDLSARVAVERTENELEQLAVALNGAFDQLHGAMEQQQRFAADASHELRTPLATIRAETEWALGRGRPDSDYRESLQVCHRAASRIQHIVERLLAMARGDALDPGVSRGPIELGRVAREVAAILQPLAGKRGVTIRTNVEAAVVAGEADGITDVVMNLLANAVEYNRDGGAIVVDVWPQEGEVFLRVRDTGVGIAAVDLPYVFDRFYRADKSRADPTGGVGLGLSIAKQVVEAHGGRISCESTKGCGTQVIVALPRVV